MKNYLNNLHYYHDLREEVIYIKINTKEVIANATSEASAITGSVLVMARLASVTPAKLAEAMVAVQKNGDYLAKFTAELVSARLIEAYAEAATANS